MSEASETLWVGGEVAVPACKGGLGGESLEDVAAGGHTSWSARAVSGGEGVRQLRRLGTAAGQVSGLEVSGDREQAQPVIGGGGGVGPPPAPWQAQVQLPGVVDHSGWHRNQPAP